MTNIIEQEDTSRDFSYEICHVELEEFEYPDSGENSINRNCVDDDDDDDAFFIGEDSNKGSLFHNGTRTKLKYVEDNSECYLLKRPSKLQRSNSFARVQKALKRGIKKVNEHIAFFRAFVAMMFFNVATIVSARTIVPSSTATQGVHRGDVSNGAIGKGLGFVWRSFGDIRKVIGSTSSLTNLKMLHNSIEKGSETILHTLQDVCATKNDFTETSRKKNKQGHSGAGIAVERGSPDDAPIDIQVMIKPGYVKQRVEKTKIKKTISSYQSVYDFHEGLDEDEYGETEENRDDMRAEENRDLDKGKKRRDHMLELVDAHLKNSAEMDDADANEASIHTLWDSFEDLSKFSHHAHTQDILKYENSEVLLFPATMAAKKIFQASSLTGGASSTSSKSLSATSVNLKQSPEAIRGLLTVLERAHWWCNNPFAKYSNYNAAQVHVLSTTPKCMVVGFRGSSTILDIIADLSIGSSEGPLGVNVHQGFLRALNSVNEGDVLLQEIEAIVSKYGVKRIIFAGYSLGGAVASLFLLKYGPALEEKGIDFRCVTFGCPRFIKQSDVEKLPVELTSKIMHTFSEGDPIPMSLTSYLPWATRYAHVGNTVVLKADGTSMTVEKEEGIERQHTIKWANPLAFHNHLQENYQKLINFAQIQLKINHLIHNPITKSISNMLKQEKLNKEWKEYFGINKQNEDSDESENFFSKVLNDNEDFPELSYAYR